MKRYKFLLLIVILVSTNVYAKEYNSYKGLVMAGYQGWFNTPDDGADRGWYHYQGKNGFKPGSCSVDLWPDVSEYSVLYKTAFKHKDGSSAYTFSSHDPSTVDIHFRWMKEYGIDGVFMQRFIAEIKKEDGKMHLDHVLNSAVASSQKYERAISIMYDLSGMHSSDYALLLKDIDQIEAKFGLKNRNQCSGYLYHNGKPLVAVWGIGFNDGRKYGLNEASKIVEGLIKRGYSVLVGVPSYWRTLDNDTERNTKLHDIIKKCDVVLPWFVGRYDETSYDVFKKSIEEDLKWCKNNKVDYVPLCYPGFSWRNMNGKESFYVSRNSGSFLWKQFVTVINYGVEMIYVAMFDEIDEATAIFPCLNKKNVPKNGKMGFEGFEDHLPTDFYLTLTGKAGKMLRKEMEVSESVPSVSFSK